MFHTIHFFDVHKMHFLSVYNFYVIFRGFFRAYDLVLQMLLHVGSESVPGAIPGARTYRVLVRSEVPSSHFSTVGASPVAARVGSSRRCTLARLVRANIAINNESQPLNLYVAPACGPRLAHLLGTYKRTQKSS